MGTRTSNGGGAALGAAQGRVQRLRVDGAVHEARPVTDLAELRRALAATELRCEAALRQLDRLRRRDTLHAQETALLTEAVLKARRFAYHDELTRLPNRQLLLDRFKLAVALAQRHDQHVALLFLDLDRFKHVNDTLGHSAGDKLLQQVAVRLLACIRASDTACRYGGDEFVVLLPELSGREGAVVAADHILMHLAAPYVIDGAEISITTSLGIAVNPVDAHGFDDLLRVADRAMYRDKARCPAAPSFSDGGVLSLLDPAETAHSGTTKR